MRLLCLMLLILWVGASSAQTVSTGGARATTQGEGAALNFQQADINAVISAVSKITGRNFIVDPRVRGEVTVFTSSNVDTDAVYQTFLAVLDVLGYAAVPMGSAIQIIPENEAKQSGRVAEPLDQADSDIITRTIELENVAASELVGILRPLMPSEAQIAAYPTGNVLILTDRRANVQRMQNIVANLDRRETTDLEIVSLKHARAQEIVAALKQVQQAGGSGQRAAQTLPIVAETRSNRVIMGGDDETKQRLRRLIRRLDVDMAEQATTEVIYLQNAEADTVAPLLERFAQIQSEREQSTPGAGAGRNGVGILANPSINALIVTAPESTMEAIRSVVQKIDIRRAQILVEAVIAEVSDSQTRQLGVDIAALGDNVAFASLLDPATISAIGGGALNEGINPFAFTEQGGTLGGVAQNGSGAIAGLIKALARDQNTNILSAPTLVTMDNEEAEISVGQEVPFITGQFSTSVSDGGAGGVNPFQTIERKDVGLTLTITPQISQGDTVRLDIAQEMSSISGTQASAVDLVTNKRTLTNTVAVDNGRILVLGGLIDRELQSTETGVPVLKDIPLLGALFRSRSATNRKRNLMIFIRPVIIRDATTAGYYTRQKYQPMRDVQRQSVAENDAFIGTQVPPRLRAFESADQGGGTLIAEGPRTLTPMPNTTPRTLSIREYVRSGDHGPPRRRHRFKPWYRASALGGCLDLGLRLPGARLSARAQPRICQAFSP